VETHKHTRKTIVRLLEGIGSAKEIRQYLKRFSQLDAKRFAVVKVGGAVLRDDLPALASSLGFLQQVGLTPIVLHGAGPQLDEELAAAGVAKRTIGGLRVTSPQALGVVRRVFRQQNLRLVDALHALDTRAVSVGAGVFTADYLDREALGMVGTVTGVELAPLEAALRADAIPVIASLGETAEGQLLNINADVAAGALVRALQPYKIVFLTGVGGLLDGQGRVIDSINLSTEYDQLMAQPWIDGGMRLKLEQIAELLADLPPASSVSITRPAQLATELFTHRGSGTLVRRGEQVRVFESWQGVDRARLRALIEASFGRALVPDYFERTRPYRVYVSEHYRAAMILTQEEGVAYLDKFAVHEEAQGEGLGRAVWQVMRAANPRLFWRSRHGNEVNPFYDAECDGCLKQPRWKVYWYGIEDYPLIERCVAHCAQRLPTLLDTTPSPPMQPGETRVKGPPSSNQSNSLPLSPGVAGGEGA
jgi:bifunctional N-acetylglutamate synthase/kinase